MASRSMPPIIVSSITFLVAQNLTVNYDHWRSSEVNLFVDLKLLDLSLPKPDFKICNGNADEKNKHRGNFVIHFIKLVILTGGEKKDKKESIKLRPYH